MKLKGYFLREQGNALVLSPNVNGFPVAIVPRDRVSRLTKHGSPHVYPRPVTFEVEDWLVEKDATLQKFEEA